MSTVPELLSIPGKYTSLADLKLVAEIMNRLSNSRKRQDYKRFAIEGELIFRDSRGVEWVVPSGFVTDFASIPRVFRFLWGPASGPHKYGATLHDYAYSTVDIMTKKDADRLFKEANSAAGSNSIVNFIMHAALRVGGIFAWRSNRKKLRNFGKEWRMLTGEIYSKV